MSSSTKPVTFNQLQDSKLVKRFDAQKALIQNIHVLEGFNARTFTEAYKQSIIDLAEKISNGLQVAPLECAPGVNGPEVVDGHTRYCGHLLSFKNGTHPDAKANKEGVMELWLEFFPTKAKNMFERKLRIYETQNNRKLEGPELGKTYADMMSEPVIVDGIEKKPTMEMIAKAIGMTRAHVEQMLKLHEAPPEVKEQIMAGEISSSIVVTMLRQHGDNAPAAITEEIEKAKGLGKKKVTAATMSVPKPPRKLLEEIVGYYGDISKGLSTDDRETLVKYQKGMIAEGTISVPVGRLLAMSLAHEELTRIEQGIAEKLREIENRQKQIEADV